MKRHRLTPFFFSITLTGTATISGMLGLAFKGFALESSGQHNASKLPAILNPNPVDRRSKTVIFIDPTVKDYQTLSKSIEPSASVFILDDKRDGIEQITEILAGIKAIDSIQIISHGTVGAVYLGSTELNLARLDRHAFQLQQWKQSLTETGDILLYGCDVAQGTAGKTFVQHLSQLTRADVAASTDLTGSAALKGNWRLEYATGSIDTPFALQDKAMASYPSVLKEFKVTNNNDRGEGSLRQAILNAEQTPGFDIIDLTGVSGKISLDSPLVLNDGNDLRLDDDGNTTISGENRVQIMTVKSVNLAISRLTFAEGLAKGGDGSNGGGGGLGAGGALFIEGGAEVTLNGVTFRDNRAIGGNGAAVGAQGGRQGNNGEPGGAGGGLNGSEGSPGGDRGIRQRGNISGDPGTEGKGDGTKFGGGGGGGGGGAGRTRGITGSPDDGRGGVGGPGGRGGFGAGGGGGGGGGYHRSRFKSGGGGSGTSGDFGGNGAAGEAHHSTSDFRDNTDAQADGTGGRGGGGAGLGGAIFVVGSTLNLFNCVFTGNSVAGGTGANNGQGVGGNLFNYVSTVRSNIASIGNAHNHSAPAIELIPPIGTYYTRYTEDGTQGFIYSLSRFSNASAESTWQQAQIQAQSFGGNLVTIDDAAENQWLTNTFGGTIPLWIGFTDERIEGQFRWVSGSTSTFTNWFSGEPNNAGGSQHHAYLNFKQAGRWDDGAGGARFRGIIENRFYAYNGSKYLLSGAATWEQAQAQAESLGGHLVVIESAAEQDWLVKTFGGTERFWIGLTDSAQENVFRRVNGSSSTFTNWLSGEPNNNSNEDYVEMNLGAAGKWNDVNGQTVQRGIIEIPEFNSDGNTTDSRLFVLAKPTKVNIHASGGAGADIFQLQSYDGLTTSQRVWGRAGVDVFNISVQGSTGIVGLDFNSGKLRRMAEILVEPDWQVRQQRYAADVSAAAIGLGLDFLGAVSDAAAAPFRFANEMANIQANYELDIKEYQNNLAAIGNFFDNQGNQGWGTVNVTLSRSIVEIMDFEPGIDIITLPKLNNNEAYRYTTVTGIEGTAVEVAYSDQTNKPSTFLRIYIAPSLLPRVLGQNVGLTEFIARLSAERPTHSVIDKTTNRFSTIAVSGLSYTGTVAGDNIYVAQNNATQEPVRINGLDGNDIIKGRKTGRNALYGDGGNDQIAPGSINDLVEGGLGFDQADYSDWDQPISLSLPVANTDCTNASVSSSNSLVAGICNIESVVGTRFSDTIDISRLIASPGDNSAFNLEGGKGNDKLVGSQFRDVIHGAENDDTLEGGAEDDVLDGGSGKDTLTGGTGKDSFILGDATSAYYDDNNILTSGSNDFAEIIDFSAEDKIHLHGAMSDYRLVIVGADTHIYLDKPAPEADELIGIVRNRTNWSLTGSEFTFVPKP
jgi:hypothetical protein